MAEFYTSEQTAEMIGVHLKTLGAYIKLGLLNPTKKGKANFYSLDEITELLKMRKLFGRKPYAKRKGK